MTKPSVIQIALIAILISSIFLVNGLGSSLFLGRGLDSFFSALDNQQTTLLPKANALQKDLMLDVSPRLHPDILAGQGANEIKFEHFNDPDIHCEDCLRMVIPNVFDLAAAQKGIGSVGAAFSNNVGYNFEGATKARFYVMSEQEGVKLRFMSVGNDIANDQTSRNSESSLSGPNKSSAATAHQNTLFKNQRFAVISGTVAPKQNNWNYFEMDVNGLKGLDNIKYPFAFEVTQGGKGRNTILYLKGVSYSDEPTLNRFLLNSSSPVSGNLTNANSTASTLSTPLNATLSTPDNSTTSASSIGNNQSTSNKVVKNTTRTSSSTNEGTLLQRQVQNSTTTAGKENEANTTQANVIIDNNNNSTLDVKNKKVTNHR